MALVARIRIKSGGRWVLPGQPMPADTPQDVLADLVARGHVIDHVTPAEVEQVNRITQKLAKLRERVEAARAAVAAGEVRLAELGEPVDLEPLKDAAKGKGATDEAKAALRDAQAANAERERVTKQLEKDREALAVAEAALAALEE